MVTTSRPRSRFMMRKGLLAVLLAALASLGFASAAPTLAGSPHDKIDEPTIVFDDSPSTKHSTTKQITNKYNTTATPNASSPATSATLNSDVIIQDGTGNKSHVYRDGGTGHQTTIEQT